MLTRKKRVGIGKQINQEKIANPFVNKSNCDLMLIFVVVGFSDSSPKSSAAKNVHLLSRETIQDTANMLSTPPTRRNRFLSNQNAMNDDSPVLSQENINISWKWNNEGTPVRSTNKVSKLRQRSSTNSSPMQQQLQHLKHLTKNKRSPNSAIVEGTSSVGGSSVAAAAAAAVGSATASTSNAEPENNSPKGLYKFQEEMRKIQFDLESDTSCDNINNDKSMTMADAGYPIHADQTNANFSDNLDVEMVDDACGQAAAMHQAPPEIPPAMPTSQKSSTANEDVELANDLFNDSDFDQILLTCKIPAQKSTTTSETVTAATNQMPAIAQPVANSSGGGPSQMSVKKASSAPEIKTQNSNSDSSGSNWNLIDDDCFDDFVRDFDIPDDADAFNTSASKFTRHKSMPQPQPQTSSSSYAAPSTSSTISKSKVSMGTTTTAVAAQQQSNVYQNNLSRKSFTRHESMPISNHSTMNRLSNANNSTHHSAMRPNSSMFVALHFRIIS